MSAHPRAASLAAFSCGLVFAIGLALSGMTLPSKVIGFLDLFGTWDPSLALVMAGALAVLFAMRFWTPARPVFSARFPALPADRIDLKLALGAAIFGVGWGLSGFCPGPAIVSLGAGTLGALIFAPAMLVGAGAYRLVESRVLRAEVEAEALNKPSECG